jgi:hypothetical protein
VPHVSGTTFSITLLEGAPFGPNFVTFPTVIHQVGSPIGGNFPGQPNLPKQPPLPSWPPTAILPDQKTNFKVEYGLGFLQF